MKLVWTQEPFAAADHSYVGRLPHGLPTAHFVISESPGGFCLSGSFVPDGLDGHEYKSLERAQAEAQGWLDSWIKEFTEGWKGQRILKLEVGTKIIIPCRGGHEMTGSDVCDVVQALVECMDFPERAESLAQAALASINWPED